MVRRRPHRAIAERGKRHFGRAVDLRPERGIAVDAGRRGAAMTGRNSRSIVCSRSSWTRSAPEPARALLGRVLAGQRRSAAGGNERNARSAVERGRSCLVCSCNLHSPSECCCGCPLQDLEKSRREPGSGAAPCGPESSPLGSDMHREPSGGSEGRRATASSPGPAVWMSSCTTPRSGASVSAALRRTSRRSSR